MTAMYDSFAKSFSDSRKNMKWWEIDYFLSIIKDNDSSVSLLDIWCGNGRLLELMEPFELKIENYLWIDNSVGLLEEAKKLHPDNSFLHLDMQDISTIKEKYDYIFFIASFHHLESIEDRENVLLSTYNLLNDGGRLFMTNWALDSEINTEKYLSSKIQDSQNIYGGTDYNIKFGEFDRYYHCFSLEELENISECSGFNIDENRLFDNKKNFLTILRK